MKRRAGKRLLREEAGFTLAEVMVTIMVMLVVLFALYNIFDMSMRVFSFGNNEVEAVENARLGLERMEREVRAAYPVDKAADNTVLLSNWTKNSISFGNDLDGNRKIQCPTPETNPRCETISYNVYESPPRSGRYALGRVNSVGGGRDPVVEFVDYTDANDTGLSFTYCKSGDAVPNDACGDGFDEVNPGSGNEGDVDKVRMQINVVVDEDARDEAAQTLSTDVALRNRVDTSPSPANPPSPSPPAPPKGG